ncbi:uncharacterized protein LOC112566482 isoform X2 [Pomacea canaliculata]|uniref:uncharacterized protein LOC112566482 isoform X2 n=1 Tax=Pomacea canaliculata TaxID=400727 RepID=UPI000D72D830|nr:uncharacterized protein LOC112566482 isoform X2 [Pomacea canaliculata]
MGATHPSFIMKIVLCLLLVAVVYADQEKRLFLEEFDVLGLFDTKTIETTVCGITSRIGGDDTETQCEGVCHSVLQGETVAENFLHSGCPLVCRSLQYLVHMFPCSTPAA